MIEVRQRLTRDYSRESLMTHQTPDHCSILLFHPGLVIGGGVLRNAGEADVSSFVGHEFDIVASYEILKDIALEIGYGHFFAENYITDTTAGTGGADDADFFYLQMLWTF